MADLLLMAVGLGDMIFVSDTTWVRVLGLVIFLWALDSYISDKIEAVRA